MIADVNEDDDDDANTPQPALRTPGSNLGTHHHRASSASVNNLTLERYQSYEPDANILPHRPISSFHAGKLLEMIYKDVQTRMVLQSQIILRSDVDAYVPHGDDLDYPNKIKQDGECFPFYLKERDLRRDLICDHVL